MSPIRHSSRSKRYFWARKNQPCCCRPTLCLWLPLVLLGLEQYIPSALRELGLTAILCPDMYSLDALPVYGGRFKTLLPVLFLYYRTNHHALFFQLYAAEKLFFSTVGYVGHGGLVSIDIIGVSLARCNHNVRYWLWLRLCLLDI